VARTLVEKILLAHCDADELVPGEIVSLRVYNVPAKNRRIERIRLATGER
jgi:hypothetical protein